MATLEVDGIEHEFEGHWVEGTPWQRFGLYNSYVVVRPDGRTLKMPAHAGELVPGSTEDLIAALRAFDLDSGVPRGPMTLELDPTYRCASRDCGGFCFSAAYRSMAPSASIPTPLIEDVIRTFDEAGGRILRFDGGGDPLLHPDVRSGALVEFANGRGLKTTILTSGDLLDRSDVCRIAESECYVRISLNAATDRTRRLFHGNEVSLKPIVAGIERLVASLERMRSETPVGATFLLAPMNYQEVLDCAHMAREIGVRHFSVRRVLGPDRMRPQFTSPQELELAELLNAVRSLHSDKFRVAVPWRAVADPDLNPSAGDFSATRCWQSTFKTVLEPGADGSAHLRLCGRYRGGGAGQLLTLPPLWSVRNAGGWVEGWRQSFSDFPISRSDLPKTCVSCIDRGFIQMVDRLIRFVGDTRSDFRILHLDSPNPYEGECQDLSTALQ